MKWTKLQKEIAYAFLFNDGFDNRNKAAEWIIKEKGDKGNKTNIYEEINKLMDLDEIIEKDGKLIYNFKDDDLRDFFQKLKPIFLNNKNHFFKAVENMEDHRIFADASNENLIKDILTKADVKENDKDIAVTYYKKFKEKHTKGMKEQLD